MPSDRRLIHPRPPTNERGGGERLNSGRDPRRESVPPLTEPESERLWRLLQDIDDGQKQMRAHVERRDEEFDRRLREVESAVLRVQTLDAKFDNILQKLNDVLASDRQQNDRLLSLEAQKQAAAIADASGTTAGHDAGKKVAKTWTSLGIAVSLALAILERCGPPVLEFLRHSQ